MKKIIYTGILAAFALSMNTMQGQSVKLDDLPAPVISIIPDDITVILEPNSFKAGFFYIVSEEPDTRTATWSTYIDYSPLEMGTGPEFNLAQCDIYSAGAHTIGYSEASDIEIGMKLQPIDYKDQLGGMLKKIAFYIDPTHYPGSDLTFRVYSQGRAENVPGDILAEKVLPTTNFVGGAWNWVDITPVQLTGEEYWITVAMLQAADTYPLTLDNTPAVSGGDWIKIDDNQWYRLSDDGTSNYNWAIQVRGDGKVQKLWGTLNKTYGFTEPEEATEFIIAVNSATYKEDMTYTANIIVVADNRETDPDPTVFIVPLTMDIRYPYHPITEVKEVIVDGKVAEKQTGMPYDYTVSIETNKETVEIIVIIEDEGVTVKGEIGEQPVKYGINDFTFTVVEICGLETDYKLIVMADIITAISEIDNAVQLYPNPVTDYLYLKSDVAIDQVTIYNLTGKVVKQIEQPGLSIDLSDFASGIYLLKVSTPQGETMKKFIKE